MTNLVNHQMHTELQIRQYSLNTEFFTNPYKNSVNPLCSTEQQGLTDRDH